RLDRSAGHRAGAGQAEVPMVVRHAAMHVEAPRRALPSALWRSRPDRNAERMDLSDSLPAAFARHGSDAALDASLRRARTTGTPGGVRRSKPRTGVILLRALSRGGLPGRRLRVPARKTRTVGTTLVVIPATFLLSAGDVLRNDQICGDRGAGRDGRMG